MAKLITANSTICTYIKILVDITWLFGESDLIKVVEGGLSKPMNPAHIVYDFIGSGRTNSCKCLNSLAAVAPSLES